MKNRLLFCFPFCFISMFFAFTEIYGKTYKVAIKEQASSNIYAEIIKAIVETKGNNVSIQVLPAARSEYLISNKLVDIQLPQIETYDKNKKITKNFDYSSVILFEASFVLYCNKNKYVNAASLKKGNPDNFKIEADPTLIDIITEFKFLSTNNFESSLIKISLNRIDGFIMSQYTGDAALRKTGLKNIKRQFYTKRSITITLQKGASGGEIDKMLVEGLREIKASGKFQNIMGPLIEGTRYNDWQP